MVLIGGFELIASLALGIWTSSFAVGMRLQLFSSKSQPWSRESSLQAAALCSDVLKCPFPVSHPAS